jgi:molybdate transport system regulatory protein
MRKSNWQSDWRVGVRVWVERRGQAILGEGRAELLAAIDREHSITKAARAVGMSYRRAWTMIQEVNEAAGEALVTAAVGGTKGGGARLTPHGRMAVDVYAQVRQSLIEAAGGALHRTVSSDDGRACLHIAAAISVQEAVGQILAEYALREPTIRVRTIFGASNELADHLLAGAPGDLFIAAEQGELDRLEKARLLVDGSRRVIAQNGLAIVGAPANKQAVKKAADLLLEVISHVALAEPACPLGQHSRSWLEKIGIYDRLLPKVLHVDNSRAVLAAVVAGAAEVVFVF